MSDEHDEGFHAVLIQLIASYAMFGRIFHELPVPVALPHGIVAGSIMREAIVRTAELAEDQPMPVEQQMQLERACLLWIAADHMLAVYHHEQEMEFLAAAAVHCIDVAEDAALSLGEWLVDQVKQQE